MDVTRKVDATPEQVWAVLEDGWLYPSWVVGASRMRAVGEDWPAQGQRLHHSAGLWPMVTNDETVSIESEPPRHLRLQAKGGPAGEGANGLADRAAGAGLRRADPGGRDEGPRPSRTRAAAAGRPCVPQQGDPARARLHRRAPVPPRQRRRSPRGVEGLPAPVRRARGAGRALTLPSTRRASPGARGRSPRILIPMIGPDRMISARGQGHGQGTGQGGRSSGPRVARVSKRPGSRP